MAPGIKQEDNLVRMRHSLAVIMTGFMPAAAMADDVKPCTISPELHLSVRDTQRLNGLDESRAKGLAAVEKEADPDVGNAVAGMFDRGVITLAAVTPGMYRCRTIKLGGQDPALSSVVYGYFACKIGKATGGWSLAKTTGSQNFSGMLTPAGDGLVYKGASFYGYEGPRAYGDDPDRDQVGCMYGVADNPRHYMLELPSPLLESLHDIIEFVPAR